MDISKEKGQSLQDAFLSRCQKEKLSVDIFLVSGIRLKGHIDSFDQYAIFLNNGSKQLVYKHQISTVLPSH